MAANARSRRYPYRSDDDVVEHAFADRQLLVVSNREPYEHAWDDGADPDAGSGGDHDLARGDDSSDAVDSKETHVGGARYAAVD